MFSPHAVELKAPSPIIIIIIQHFNLHPFRDKLHGVKIGRPQTQVDHIMR